MKASITKLFVVFLFAVKALALVSPSSLASRQFSGTQRRWRSSILWPARNGKQHVLSAEPAVSVSSATTNSTGDLLQPVCRIVTRADSKLPTSPSFLPSNLFQSPRLLDKFDAYYNARAHRATRGLDYLYREKGSNSKRQALNETENEVLDPQQEQRLVGVLRNALEDAGFELLNRRDIDLCDSLNVGYLLRLSIVPDVSELDESISREFYPEWFHDNGTIIDKDEFLFDGRILVYWRGYSEEVTQGRLLLPKLDYLQASIVQRSAAWVKRRLDQVENAVARKFIEKSRKVRKKARRSVEKVADSLPLQTVATALRSAFTEESDVKIATIPRESGRLKLGRYGGSKVRFVGSPDPADALEPFMICEIPAERTIDSVMHSLNSTIAAAEHDMRDEINHNRLTCEYDKKMATFSNRGEPTRMELLERVSINNLVDLFTRSGRRKVIQAIFEKSELVEPTYEEVVVVWRPKKKEKPEIKPPRWLSEAADMFDLEGFQQASPKETVKTRANIEIRNFEGVPMANLPAVLPKTKLVFRPADAFLFDMISFATFLLVVGSIRLDSPRLDLLAIVSVSLWILRTVFRYSNKLARYDLLVKTFLTTKISHRNAGALRYIASEAGAQRAVRAALVYYWICNFVGAIKSPFRRRGETSLSRLGLQEKAQDDINSLLKTETQVQMHVERSLEDLEDLQIVEFDDQDSQTLSGVLDPSSSEQAIQMKWIEFLEEEDGRNDMRPGGNSTQSTRPRGSSEPYATEKSPSQEIDRSDVMQTEFEEARKRLASSLAKSASRDYKPPTIYTWQKGILSSETLRPAFDGVVDSRRLDQKDWYF